MKTIEEALKEAAQKLKSNGIEEARLDATTLLSFILNKDRVFLLAHDKDVLDEDALKMFFSYIERRSLKEPLQYITGQQEFFGLTFEVTPDVLIPRPETEILVEAALEILDSKFKIQNSKLELESIGQTDDDRKKTKDKRQRTKDKNQIGNRQSAIGNALVCDVGVGSGCIIVSLLNERKTLRGVGLDISKDALSVAEKNAKRHGVNERLTFFESDCFSSIEGKDFEFDLIVSNPPYINENDFQTLQSEVKDYEPRQALTPEGDGLHIIKKLIKDAPQFLKPEGYLLIEIGYDQSERISQIIDSSLLSLVEIRKDLQDIPRVVVLKKV
jgi:release factor glutamine methyltransferase